MEIKVYAVTAGSHSEWDIESVWFSREEAEKEIARMKNAYAEDEPEFCRKLPNEFIEEWTVRGQLPAIILKQLEKRG